MGFPLPRTTWRPMGRFYKPTGMFMGEPWACTIDPRDTHGTALSTNCSPSLDPLGLELLSHPRVLLCSRP